MKEIKLTQGKVALVDDEDYEELNQYKWYAVKDRRTFYARGNVPFGNGKKILMHRIIMKTPEDMEVDHIDHNGLNCQRYNMRNCTCSQNRMNVSLHRDSTSGYKGVYWNKRVGRWYARIGFNGKRKHLGYFDLIEEAATVYNEAATKYHGAFALLNDIGG